MSQPERRSASFAQASPFEWLENPVILGSLLAALAFVIYLPALGFEFVSDDQMQIVSNPLVLSWRMVPRALQSNLWFQTSSTGTYYRPLFIVWGILNHALFGFDPRGWHLLNIILHVAATCLVFMLFRRLGVAHWTAALAALFFAIHPVHIETVAWVSAGADSLMTVLFVLAFLTYLRARESASPQRAGWQVLSLLAAAGALLSKENAVSFPMVILLYEWLFPPAKAPQQAVAKAYGAAFAALPYLLLDVVYLIQRKHVLHEVIRTGNLGAISLSSTFKTIPIVLVHYFRILVFPAGLNVFYYTSPVDHLLSARFILPALGCLGLAASIWYWSKRDRDPLILFFGVWTLLCLAPALYLPNFKMGDFVRDRYIYLPSIGFIFLLSKALQGLRPFVESRRHLLQYALPAVLSVAFVYGTMQQELNWANEVVLFYRGYTLSPENANAAKFLAAALNQRGEPEKAAALLEQTLSKDQDDSYSLFTLSMIDSRLGKTAEATKLLTLAINKLPQYYLGSFDGLTNVGIALSNLHRYEEAEQMLRKALQMEPDAVQAHFYLGLVLLRTGRVPEGEEQIRQAISINSSIEDFHWALGLSRQMQGDLVSAAAEYQEELRLHPGNKWALASQRLMAQSTSQ